MTNNRTNEQIVAEAVDSIHLSDWDDAQALCVKNVTAAVIAGLDTAGRLVAAQGAAPQAECPERPGGRHCEASRPGHKLHWSNGPGVERGNVKLIADARALSEYLSEHIPGSRYKPMIDRLANALEACSVLPSSTVDEAALIREAKAEALIGVAESFNHGVIYPARVEFSHNDVFKILRARAAEYRKGDH